MKRRNVEQPSRDAEQPSYAYNFEFFITIGSSGTNSKRDVYVRAETDSFGKGTITFYRKSRDFYGGKSGGELAGKIAEIPITLRGKGISKATKKVSNLANWWANTIEGYETNQRINEVLHDKKRAGQRKRKQLRRTKTRYSYHPATAKSSSIWDSPFPIHR